MSLPKSCHVSHELTGMYTVQCTVGVQQINIRIGINWGNSKKFKPSDRTETISQAWKLYSNVSTLSWPQIIDFEAVVSSDAGFVSVPESGSAGFVWVPGSGSASEIK